MQRRKILEIDQKVLSYFVSLFLNQFAICFSAKRK